MNGHRIEQTTILHDKCTLTVADLLFTLAYNASNPPFMPRVTNDGQPAAMNRQHENVVRQLSAATGASTTASTMTQRG